MDSSLQSEEGPEFGDFTFRTHAIFFAGVFILLHLLYCGIVKPLIQVAAFCLSKLSGKSIRLSSSTPLKGLQLICFASGVGVVMVSTIFSERNSVIINVLEWIEANSSSDQGFEMSFAVYFFSLNWDTVILLVFIILVRWRRSDSPYPVARGNEAVIGRRNQVCPFKNTLQLQKNEATFGVDFTRSMGGKRASPQRKGSMPVGRQREIVSQSKRSRVKAPRRRRSFYGETLLLGWELKRVASYYDIKGVGEGEIGSEIRDGIDNIDRSWGNRVGEYTYRSQKQNEISRSKTFCGRTARDQQRLHVGSAMNIAKYPIMNNCGAEGQEQSHRQPDTMPYNAGNSHAVSSDGVKYITPSDHIYIIACHNSSDRLCKTIDAILRHAEPWQIYIADNGSSVNEVIMTRQCCIEASKKYENANPEYGGDFVQFCTISEGSKTVAQFATAFNAYRKAYMSSDSEDCHETLSSDWELNDPSASDTNSSSSLRNGTFAPKYVTFLDDDTLLPENWSEHIITSTFVSSDDIKCVAYPLRSSRKDLALPAMEDLEYLISDFVKIAHTKLLSTTIFASGACNTWRLDCVVDILFRHDTMHHGDDLQQGLLLHSFAGRRWVVDPFEDKVDGSFRNTPVMSISSNCRTDDNLCEIVKNQRTFDSRVTMNETQSNLNSTFSSTSSQGVSLATEQSEEQSSSPSSPEFPVHRPIKYHCGGYRVCMSSEIVVPTDVPVCWFHVADLFPNFLLKWFSGSKDHDRQPTNHDACAASEAPHEGEVEVELTEDQIRCVGDLGRVSKQTSFTSADLDVNSSIDATCHDEEHYISQSGILFCHLQSGSQSSVGPETRHGEDVPNAVTAAGNQVRKVATSGSFNGVNVVSTNGVELDAARAINIDSDAFESINIDEAQCETNGHGERKTATWECQKAAGNSGKLAKKCPTLCGLTTCMSCECGEPSLFRQRAKGWDVSRQRFLWKYLKAACHVASSPTAHYQLEAAVEATENECSTSIRNVKRCSNGSKCNHSCGVSALDFNGRKGGRTTSPMDRNYICSLTDEENITNIVCQPDDRELQANYYISAGDPRDHDVEFRPKSTTSDDVAPRVVYSAPSTSRASDSWENCSTCTPSVSFVTPLGSQCEKRCYNTQQRPADPRRGHGPTSWYWATAWARILCLHDAVLILNDWFSIAYGLYFLIVVDNKYLFAFNILLTWAFQLLVFDLFNWVVLYFAHLGPLECEVVTLFPLLYKLPTIVFLRLFGMFYNLIYYYPFNRTKTKVLKRMEKCQAFQGMILNTDT
eukprot:Nk52_evm1s2118 gene=Nk52_evmTU1s2118